MNRKAGVAGGEAKLQVLLVSADVRHSMPVSSLSSVVTLLCKSTKRPAGLMGRKRSAVKRDSETLDLRV